MIGLRRVPTIVTARRTCRREAGAVPHVISPWPQVKATLDDLARRFESELGDLDRALAAARTRDEARAIEQRRRELRQRYRAAKDDAKRILRLPVVW